MNGFLTIVDPMGKEKKVNVVIEFDALGNHYLVYTDNNDINSETFDCCIVKVINEDGNDVIIDIDDDDEYSKVEKIFEEIIEMSEK